MEGGPFRGPFKFEAVQYPDKLGKIGSSLINVYFPNLHVAGFMVYYSYLSLNIVPIHSYLLYNILMKNTRFINIKKRHL